MLIKDLTGIVTSKSICLLNTLYMPYMPYPLRVIHSYGYIDSEGHKVYYNSLNYSLGSHRNHACSITICMTSKNISTSIISNDLILQAC